MDKLQELYLEQLTLPESTRRIKEVALRAYGNISALRMNYQALQNLFADQQMKELSEHYGQKFEETGDLLDDLKNYIDRYFPFWPKL